MNKYIYLTLSTQTLISSFSIGLYTIDKTPKEGVIYYKVKYTLDKEGGFYTENGLLQEIIKKCNSNSQEKQQYKITYIYHNYKAKINNHLSDLQNNNGYIKVNSTVIVDSECQVISIENWHPTVFYLNNLRSSLITSFDKRGDSINIKLKDNSHTYQETCNSTIEYKKLASLWMEYKINTIETIIEPKTYLQIPTYTFDWNALRSLNTYSERHGKIQVNNKGIISRMNVYVPHCISQFYIASKVQEQSGWLNLTKITQKKFEKLCSKNIFLKNGFFEKNTDSKQNSSGGAFSESTEYLSTTQEPEYVFVPKDSSS